MGKTNLPAKNPKETSLRAALSKVGNNQATQSIISIKASHLESVQARKEELEKELIQCRKNYKYWLELFKNLERQESLLRKIQLKAEMIKKDLEAVGDYPTLREREADEGGEKVLGDIQLMLIWLDEQIDVSSPLGEQQYEAIALLILQEFGWLRLEDLAVCFKNVLAGKLGKVYNSIDTVKVMDWVRQYAEGLRQARAYKNELQHQHQKTK